MFEYAVSPRAMSEVISQNLPSNQHSLVREDGTVNTLTMCFSDKSDAVRELFCGLWRGWQPGNKAEAERVLGMESKERIAWIEGTTYDF